MNKISKYIRESAPGPGLIHSHNLVNRILIHLAQVNNTHETPPRITIKKKFHIKILNSVNITLLLNRKTFSIYSTPSKEEKK